MKVRLKFWASRAWTAGGVASRFRKDRLAASSFSRELIVNDFPVKYFPAASACQLSL